MERMDSGGIKLGYRVRVVEVGSGRAVMSERLELGWNSRTGRAPGTAVRWEGRFWEVVERGGGSPVERWLLEPWPEGEAMRRVVDLDVDSLRRLAL